MKYNELDNGGLKTIAQNPRDALALDPTDAAIIFKNDGTCVVSFPQTNATTMGDHVLTGAAVIYALRNEKLLALIRDHFDQECRRIADQSAANLDPAALVGLDDVSAAASSSPEPSQVGCALRSRL